MQEEFVPLTPEKEKRVQNRVSELARNIQIKAERVKQLKKKPLKRFRPGIKDEIKSTVTSAKKDANLIRNASDALTKTSVDREASLRTKRNEIKNKLADLEGKNNIKKFQREEFEYILDVLVCEGYVDNYDNAFYILEAMSDKWFESILMEAPYDIVHHGSKIDGTRIGPEEPKVIKTYKNKTRAKNKAEEMNQEYGAHAYSVRYRPEQ